MCGCERPLPTSIGGTLSSEGRAMMHNLATVAACDEAEVRVCQALVDAVAADDDRLACAAEDMLDEIIAARAVANAR